MEKNGAVLKEDNGFQSNCRKKSQKLPHPEKLKNVVFILCFRK